MSAESWPAALGSQGENGKRTGESVICHCQFFLSVFPDLSSPLQMFYVSLIELQIQPMGSYTRFLCYQARAAQENPLCSPKHVLAARRELGDRLTHQRRHSFRSLLFCLFSSPAATSFLLKTTSLIYCTFALLSTWKVFLSH